VTRKNHHQDAENAEEAILSAPSAPLRWEFAVLAAILAVGAYLRFSHLGLLEFQGDEAFAAQLALGFVKHGKLPLAGLMSSVGVTNPPLFSYLLIPMFAISENPVAVSCCIAALGLAAVVMTWHIGRKYYGPVAGLVAATFFATSPWAVIYSRKIWAQDFVPVFATATMWAVHSVVLGNRPKAIFWCVLLPICVIQIHFSGVALTVTVLAILAWLRPKIDWRFAAAGLIAAIITMIPYFKFQQAHDWADFKQALHAVGGGQQWEQLHGVTTHPVTGYRFPSKQNLSYALAIMNGRRIEDVLGIAAGREFDQRQVWTNKAGGGHRYFADAQTFGDFLLFVQRAAFISALVWLAVIAVKGIRGLKVTEAAAHAAWIQVLWFVLPLAIFMMAGLWTYLTYFVILYPVHFLACGVAAERIKSRPLAAGATVLLAAGCVVFMLDYYRFVDRYGGAQGTFGTALGYKQQACRYIAEQGGAKLREESETQLALAMARSQQEQAALAEKLKQPILIELNHEGRPELPQLEWALLITQATAGHTTLSNTTVILVDGNREALQRQQWQQLAQYPNTNFGPICLFFVKR
jgi:hypothetical protein